MMNIELKNELVEAMKAAGFPNVENTATMDFAFYKAVLNAILTVADLGPEYFESHTTLGPKLKKIVYEFSEKYKPA